MLTGIELKAELAFPENAEAYSRNLEGLGLISLRRDVYIVRSHPTYEDLIEQYRTRLAATTHFNSETHEIRFIKGKVEITPYGMLFIEACLRERNEA